MPIHPDLRDLYPPTWREVSRYVRFVRAKSRCEQCKRPHLAWVMVLHDGRWFDDELKTWRDGRGRQARWPDLLEATPARWTRVVTAAAHLNGDVRSRNIRNIKALCQRCHLAHDRPMHLVQRRLTVLQRYALGDLFSGPYVRAPVVALRRIKRVLPARRPCLPVRRLRADQPPLLAAFSAPGTAA